MMDIAQEDNGRYAARTLSNISIASSASAKVQNPSVRGGHMQFDPSFTEPKHMGHRKVKFMCSSAGKILPRPSDMKLRYVGGETRMISVPRYIHYAAFLSKMVEIYGPEITLRYQLPEEDLDALVSVSSDEDLENMMEECDRLNSTEGLSRLRVFVFPDSELVVTDLRDMADPKTSEQKFVDAVNAMSADLPSGMHRNFTPAEDRFNDAYNAWNGIQMQEKGFLVYNNPRSEILPLEKYVPSENLHIIENLMPNHESDPISPRPHVTFMGQHAFLARDAAADMLGNANNQYGAALDIDEFCDLERGGSEGSSVSSEHELHHKYAKNEWAPSSQMQTQKGLTSYDNGEDKTYRAEQRFVVEHATATGHFGIEEHLNRVESVDEYKSAESQLHGDHLSLSPGAFLQKQLQADQPLSPGAFLQKQLQADRHQQETHSENFLVVNDMQPLPVNSGFRQHQAQQQAFPEQHELKDHHEWEGLPVYDSSILLDQETQAFGHMDCNSSRTQAVTANKVHLLSQETSAAVFPTSSAPPSPPRGKMESERNSDPFPQHANNIHEVSAAAFSALDYASTLDSVVQASSSNVSSPAMNTGGQQVQMHVTGFPGQITMQNYNHGHASQVPWVTSDPASYTFSSPDAIPRDEMLNQGNHQGRMMRKALDLYSDAPPTLVPSSVTTKQLFGLQNDDGKDFLPFLNRLHSPGLSLSQEYLPPGQSSTYAAVQHENEHFNRLSHYGEASPPSVMDNFPTLDMISDLLQSSQLIDCLPAESSTAGSVKSRSVCSLEELPHQEGNDLIARGGEESVLAEIDSSDLPLSMQRTSKDPSFPSIQNSLPSKEQFDKIMATTFTSAFNNETNLNDEQSLLRDREDTTVAASDSTALTSLIETWEASLLQDEHEQHAVMQHVKHEKAREEINLVHTVDKEDALEDSQIEFEELDEFESFNYGPMNAAAIAEAEAISRGLQTIRNYDLEELRELGSGTFGTVYHGKWRGTDVAIKRIKASCFTGRQAERERLMADFWREAYILGQLHHPNVVAFYGVVPDGPGGTLATVTEYMVNGSLKQVLQNKDRTLDRRKRLLIAMDAAFGMEYLHGKNVVHFDIKCENLLVNLRDTQRPICKVGDLGLSKVKQQTFVSGGVRGTLPWMAPELLNGSSSLVSEKVDVFSFGIVMWELLTGEEPYSNMHYGAIIGGIVSNTLRPTVPSWCDRAWRSLMEKCWAADPAERPTFLEIAASLRAMETSLNAKGQGQAPITGLY